jgi:ABC-type transporter Mla subunit MlaD
MSGPARKPQRQPTSGFSNLAGSPTLVGALTTLVTLIAVFLAYNANNGLPFVPVYHVSVDVPNAARLRPNNEVRIGGQRVGAVDAITPIAVSGDEASSAGSDVAARLELKLDQSVQPLPENSVFRIRYKSAFGLKYLEIQRGDGEDAPDGYAFNGLDDGAIASTADVAGARGASNGVFVRQTESDELSNTLNAPTRVALRDNLVGYGDAFAGRGASLNEAISGLAPLLTDLAPVAKTLADPDTQLDRLITELADTSRILAPVAGRQAELFTNLADTFSALAGNPGAVEDSISRGVPALRAAVDTLPAERTFLADLSTLAARLRPGTGELRRALPSLDSAIRTGTPVLAQLPATTADLKAAFGEAQQLVDDPSTESSLLRINDLLGSASPTLQFAAPMQTVCNYINYWATFVPNAVSDRDQVGYSLRNNVIVFPLGPTEIGLPGPPPLDKITIPGIVQTGLMNYSGIAANARAGGLAPNPGEFRPSEFPLLHTPAFGPAGQKNADCQVGQFGYTLGDLRIPGQDKSSPVAAAADIPGSRGPTTLFYDQNGTRELRDTRVPSRQP